MDNKKKNYGKKDFRKNSKSRYNGNREDVSRETTDKEVNHKYNDVSWYAKNDAMLRDSASLSYNSPVGVNFPSLIKGETTHITSSRTVPTLCKLSVAMGPGMATNQASPANLAANNIYAYVRYMNSGAKNYDQPDLMLYLLAMDSIYAEWNYMKRLYGIARYYTQYNRTVPRVFFPSTAVYNDIYNNLADFRLWLNKTAAQISSFCVPAVMPLFIRHSWMFSNIYKDADSNKAQMYMFEPAIFYKYNEKTSRYGGVLQAMEVDSYNSSLSTLKTLLEDCITSVSYSEDIGIMSGDILKAYGQDKLFKLAPVDEDYSVEPVYNEEVLNQIHNSRLLPLSTQGSGVTQFNITQDPNNGFLLWGNSFAPYNSDILAPENIMINMPWDEVTPANTMVGTRLTTAYELSEDGTSLTVTAMGTEAVIRRSYWTWSSADNRFLTYYQYSDQFIIDPAAASTAYSSAQAMTTLLRIISNFDWHPLVNLVIKEDTRIKELGPIGDIDNYTVVNQEQIQKIHETAVMSLFNIPQLGSF